MFHAMQFSSIPNSFLPTYVLHFFLKHYFDSILNYLFQNSTLHSTVKKYVYIKSEEVYYSSLLTLLPKPILIKTAASNVK